MSAFDLFSFRSLGEPTAPAPAATPPAEPARGDETSRSFRDTLSDTQPARTPPERAETASTPDDSAAEVEATDPQPPRDAADAADGQEADAADSNAADPTDAVVTEPADDSSDEETSPVADLVLDLIAAFENVLENNPLSQTAGSGEDGSAFPGLTALYEALGAVSAVTGTNVGQAVAGATAAATTAGGAAVAVPLTGSANSAAGNATVPTVSPDLAAAQAQTSGDAAGNPDNGNSNSNNNGNANNPALQAGQPGSLAVNANAAGQPLPGFEAVAGSNAASPITPLGNATPASTDVSARLNPAGLTDPNATNDALNSARLTRGLNNAVNQQGGTVTLRLTPPDLGTVRIQLNLQGTNVSAQFLAETGSAQRLLTQQLGQLRSSLESQGLNVERLGVQALNAPSNSASLQQQTSGDNAQSQNQANADGRSRGQFGQSSQQNNQGRDGNADDNPAPANFTQLLTPDADAEIAPATAALDSLTGTA